MDTKEKQSPPWWDDSKLRKAYFADGYSGWVIDCGDGTCRYANAPLLGADAGEQEDGSVMTQEEADAINAVSPKWGDRVKWKDGRPDPTQIVERWEPERYDPKTGEILEQNTAIRGGIPSPASGSSESELDARA